MNESTDQEFLQKATAYLAAFSEGHRPVVPVFYNADGTLNRKRMLALPCFGDFIE